VARLDPTLSSAKRTRWERGASDPGSAAAYIESRCPPPARRTVLAGLSMEGHAFISCRRPARPSSSAAHRGLDVLRPRPAGRPVAWYSSAWRNHRASRCPRLDCRACPPAARPPRAEVHQPPPKHQSLRYNRVTGEGVPELVPDYYEPAVTSSSEQLDHPWSARSPARQPDGHPVDQRVLLHEQLRPLGDVQRGRHSASSRRAGGKLPARSWTRSPAASAEFASPIRPLKLLQHVSNPFSCAARSRGPVGRMLVGGAS